MDTDTGVGLLFVKEAEWQLISRCCAKGSDCFIAQCDAVTLQKEEMLCVGMLFRYDVDRCEKEKCHKDGD